MSKTKNNRVSPIEPNPTTGEIEYPRFRSAYDHLRDVSYASPVGELSRTKQEFADSVDVNKIVAHFTRTGRLENVRTANAKFADMSQLPGSYHESLNLVVAAREAFDALPSDIRRHFGNDVQEFLRAAHDNPDAVFGRRGPDGTPLKPPPIQRSTDAPEPKETPIAPEGGQ
ncbi:internal scaffolding protein [Apis mellifera associated microvirus 9]|nr:internal scaffolding protein [Apis mellifera associated microvirus 9]